MSSTPGDGSTCRTGRGGGGPGPADWARPVIRAGRGAGRGAEAVRRHPGEGDGTSCRLHTVGRM